MSKRTNSDKQDKSEVVETQEVVQDAVQEEAKEVVETPVETPKAPKQEEVQVEAAPEVSQEVAQEEPKQEKEAPKGPEAEAIEYLENVRLKGTPEQKQMLAAIETFAERFKPRVPIKPSQGAAWQYEFLEHLISLLKNPDYESFRKGWNVLLVYFNLHHGVNTASKYTAISEFSTSRFLFAWVKGDDACRCYTNLITLLRTTRNPDTRKHDIASIDLPRIGTNVLGEQELNNLKRFYGV